MEALLDPTLIRAIQNALQDMAGGAEDFRAREALFLAQGDQASANQAHDQFVVFANLANMYDHYLHLLQAGLDIETAKASAGYYNKLNHFRAAQKSWLNIVSPEAVAALTAPSWD